MDRRKFIKSFGTIGTLITTGCSSFNNSDNTAPRSLQRIRIINLYNEKLKVSVDLRGGEKDLNYSNIVNPISEGKEEEWVIKPGDVDNAFNYSYTMETGNVGTSTISSEALSDMLEDTNDGCLELTWLIRNPSEDIGVFPQLINHCTD